MAKRRCEITQIGKRMQTDKKKKGTAQRKRKQTKVEK